MSPTDHLDALRIAVASRNWVLVDLVIAGMEYESQNRAEAHEPVAHDPRCVVFQHGICTCALFKESTIECCDQAYVCPQSNDTECLVHGGFDNCCAHPDCPGNVQGLKVLAKEFWDSLTTPQTESFTESQVAEELGVTLPPATQWDSYEQCPVPHCKAQRGNPCVSGGYAPTGVLPGDPMDEPHKRRNLIRQNKDQECEVLREGTHSSPPVPTPPHLITTAKCFKIDCSMCDEVDEKVKELDHPADCKCVNPECLLRWMDRAKVKEVDDQEPEPDSCPNCHDPKDCTRGVNCACCKSRPKQAVCIRYNACKYPDHSAVASCIMPCPDPTCVLVKHEGNHLQGGHVKKAQDPAKYAAAKEEDARQLKIINDAIERYEAEAEAIANQAPYPHCDHCPRVKPNGMNANVCLFESHSVPCVHCQEAK